MRDAVALDRAGVACIVLEGIPREVAAMITAEVGTPTIGIGAGPECDGQVLVIHDLVNLTFAPAAKFVRRYGDRWGDQPSGARVSSGRKVAAIIRRMRSLIICRRRRRRGWIWCWRGRERCSGRELGPRIYADLHG